LLPQETMLQPNYPNPFNPTTVLPFALDRSQDVRLEIYNVLGQRIRTLVSGPMDAGFHTLVWNGHNDIGHSVAAGLYFTLLETQSTRQTRKMSLLK
jgi:flagellar hook assembly protein FlgD